MELNNVICETPEQFRLEVEKHQKAGHAPVIRGRSLYVYGEVVAELKTSRGGFRQGAGRKATTQGLSMPVTVRISEDAANILAGKKNKSEYINELILNAK